MLLKSIRLRRRSKHTVLQSTLLCPSGQAIHPCIYRISVRLPGEAVPGDDAPRAPQDQPSTRRGISAPSENYTSGRGPGPETEPSQRVGC